VSWSHARHHHHHGGGSGDDKAYLVTASATGKVRVWDVHHDIAGSSSSSGRGVKMDPICQLRHGEDSQIYACKFVDDATLLTASDDKIHIWDVESKKRIAEWRYEQLPGKSIKSIKSSSLIIESLLVMTSTIHLYLLLLLLLLLLLMMAVLP